jgi:hypothetical protein
MSPNGRKKFVQPIPELIWLRSERKKRTQRSLFDVAAQKLDSEIFQLRRCAAPDDLFRHAWTYVSHEKFFKQRTPATASRKRIERVFGDASKIATAAFAEENRIVEFRQELREEQGKRSEARI